MTNWLLTTGTKTSTSSKQQKPIKAKESIINGMEDLSMVEPETIKSKNLDVLAEYRKVERKNAANFVVIGNQLASSITQLADPVGRPCGLREKYSYGSAPV